MFFSAPSASLRLVNMDAFLMKLDPSGNILYSTYLGGSLDEEDKGVDVDAMGNAYVAGYTNSRNFPVTQNAFQNKTRGERDAFLSKFDRSGKLAYSTYIGGNGYESADGI